MSRECKSPNSASPAYHPSAAGSIKSRRSRPIVAGTLHVPSAAKNHGISNKSISRITIHWPSQSQPQLRLCRIDLSHKVCCPGINYDSPTSAIPTTTNKTNLSDGIRILSSKSTMLIDRNSHFLTKMFSVSRCFPCALHFVTGNEILDKRQNPSPLERSSLIAHASQHHPTTVSPRQSLGPNPRRSSASTAWPDGSSASAALRARHSQRSRRRRRCAATTAKRAFAWR